MSERKGESFTMEGPEALTFSAFILGLASTALIHLGVQPHPETGQAVVDLTAARQSIDVLALLHAKTRGNLTPEEEQLFASILSDLRLRFVNQRGARS
jgi:hypothetical protein